MQNSKLKNSVVMATYNGEKYIIEQLDSIKNQTLPPDEVIICDDKSTDRTCEIISDYIKKNDLENWRLYENEKNVGFYKNFFHALRLSTGDIIYLSDQDDVWCLDKIKTFTEYYLADPGLTMVQSNVKFIDSKGNDKQDNENYHYFKSGNICELTTMDMCRFAGSGFTMSFRSNVSEMILNNALDQTGLFPYHDILIGLVAVVLGRCILDRDIIDSHRVHDNNVTKKSSKSFISGRTKKGQLEILNSRVKYITELSEYAIDAKKKETLKKFARFCQIRAELIRKFNIGVFIELEQNRKMYASKMGLITDTLYSLGLEKFIILILKRNRKTHRNIQISKFGLYERDFTKFLEKK